MDASLPFTFLPRVWFLFYLDLCLFVEFDFWPLRSLKVKPDGVVYTPHIVFPISVK